MAPQCPASKYAVEQLLQSMGRAAAVATDTPCDSSFATHIAATLISGSANMQKAASAVAIRASHSNSRKELIELLQYLKQQQTAEGERRG